MDHRRPPSDPPPGGAAEGRRGARFAAMLSDQHITADPARLAAGWVRRFIAAGARAAEMMELYEQLGFEVVADPIGTDHLPDDCEDCKLLAALQFKLIYTRKRDDPAPR